MPATASMGKTIYWEPVGYSVPLHLIGDVKDIAEGWMTLNPRDIAEQNNYVYAIVKPNELAEAIPAHPYVVFIEQYRLAKCSKYGGYSELMAYRRHVLPYMAEALKKREDDTSNDRWKDLTLFDLAQVQKIYIAVGYSDLRRGIDGFASIIQNTFHMDPQNLPLSSIHNIGINDKRIVVINKEADPGRSGSVRT